MNTQIIPKRLLFLKHNPFRPQIAAALTIKSNIGLMDEVNEVLHSNVNVTGELVNRLSNTVDVDISRGRVADVVNGWNESKFSFILLVDVYHDNNKICEEIFQGYTDRVDTLERSLVGVSSATIDPSTVLYINKYMSISFRQDEMGNNIPRFNTASTILSNTGNSTDLKIIRPFDIALGLHSRSITRDLDEVTSGSVDLINPSSNFNQMSKFSDTSNSVGGRYLAKIINAASTSKLTQTYGVGNNHTSSHEDMMSSVNEVRANNIHFIKAISRYLTRGSSTRFTLGELESFMPQVATVASAFTVESYKDRVTRQSNELFNFGGDNDLGDNTLTDNTITRFQKRIVDYMFDAMMSLGFVSFSGTITNKTLSGDIHLQHSLLSNISETVNQNPAIRQEIMRLLYAKLTSSETKSIMRNDVDQAVEIVFDLSLYSSSVMININGVSSYIKIPSLCDGTFSSMIADTNNVGIITNEIENVVTRILDGSTDSGTTAVGNLSDW